MLLPSLAPLASLALFAQLAAVQPAAQPTPPVLTFPEPGLDDSAAYQGYETRLYRDAARNTVQIYLDRRDGRVVHLWADALNESVGFTARDSAGAPAPLRWTATDARVARAGRWRSLEHDLVADGRTVRLGLALLGSMRVERDLQYSGRQRAPIGEAAFRVAEVDRMLAAMEKLPAAAQTRHAALLNAPNVRALYGRLEPALSVRQTPTQWTARWLQPSLDARDTMALEIVVDPRRVEATRDGRTLTLRARSGGAGAATGVPFTVRVSTTGAPLTPLTRAEIFTPAFLSFLADATRANDARGRWLEREVRGVELLSSRQKLMAGLPTYATYFGRDMMVSALMMRPIWRGDVSEAVIGAVLRKLGPNGDVSHEEALGGQAIRESADAYARLVASGAPDSLAAAERVLRDAGRTRENYHMIDDEFHLPVLVARWLADTSVSAAHKRAFLLDSLDGGGTRAARLLKELALVSRMTAAYAREQTATNLVSFAPRDPGEGRGGWASQSWRDSGVGYANGRWAMDVNAIWAPHALEAMGQILAAFRTLGVPVAAADEPLATYARDPASLTAAARAWRGAERHFVVTLGPAEVRERVTARLAVMPAEERAWWTKRVAETGADRDSLTFLALSLDAQGKPIGVANTDVATRLFLGDDEDPATPDDPAAALRDARLIVRPYPVGLLVDAVGPVVANDAYATPPVWTMFVNDLYHSPRVVWGREVNLFLLGAARHVAAGGADAAELRDAVRKVRDAVAASGFHAELWSYGFDRGRPAARRYGSGADVQLWSTTDLAVQYALWRLKL